MSEEERIFNKESDQKCHTYLSGKAEYEKNRVVDSDDEDGERAQSRARKRRRREEIGVQGCQLHLHFFGSSPESSRLKLKAEGKKLGFKEFSAMQSEEWIKLDAEGNETFHMQSRRQIKSELLRIRLRHAAHKDDESHSWTSHQTKWCKNTSKGFKSASAFHGCFVRIIVVLSKAKQKQKHKIELANGTNNKEMIGD